jgi:hypothetical protein
MKPVPIFLMTAPLAVNKKPFHRQTVSGDINGIGRVVELSHEKS